MTEFSIVDRTSEAIERVALRSLHAHCPTRTREVLGLELHEIADGLVAIARHDPSVLINRTLGLGMQRPVTLDTLDQVRALYEAAGVTRPFVHVYPHTAPEPDPAQFQRARGWRKFDRDRAPAPPETRPCELRIERVTRDHAADFGRIVAPAFGMSENAAPLLAGLVEDERWHLFVSYDGLSPAGAGGLLIADVPDHGRAAWFEWGATDPAFRQRGSQGAIMRARIRAALDAECTAMFTETGEAVAGDPQHSYRNIERYGFKAGLLRENWRPVSAGA